MTRAQDIVISKLVEMAGEENEDLKKLFSDIAILIAKYETPSFNICYIPTKNRYQGRVHRNGRRVFNKYSKDKFVVEHAINMFLNYGVTE